MRLAEVSGRILLVDDSSAMREIIRTALESEGHDVFEMASGPQALAWLTSAPPLDLIITDLYMPAMDGLALTRVIRRLEPYRSTPILVMSIETGEELRQRARIAGVSGWLAKPLQPGHVLRTVMGVLRTRAEVVRPAGVELESRTPASPTKPRGGADDIR